MNDFSDLEAELKQLHPSAASPELINRVERALVENVSAVPTAGVLPRPRLRLNWFTLGLAGAAAAAVLLLIRVNPGSPAGKTQTVARLTPAPAAAAGQQVAGLIPDGVTHVLYDTRDEGLVFPNQSDEPVRRVRSRSRETREWKDAGTGASLRVSYPTEEVQLIPVSFQ